MFASHHAVMGQALALGIVYRCIDTHLIKKVGFSRKTAQAGAVALTQSFSSALNAHLRFQMLYLGGVYVERPGGSLRFRCLKAPTAAELTSLAQARHVGRYLERHGLIERDA